MEAPIAIVGYVCETVQFGISQNLQGIKKWLEIQKKNFKVFDVSQVCKKGTKWWGKRKNVVFEEKTTFDFRTVIFCVPLDLFPSIYVDLYPEYKENVQKVILFAPWELESCCLNVNRAYSYVQKTYLCKIHFEVWVPSTFSSIVWKKLDAGALCCVKPIFPSDMEHLFSFSLPLVSKKNFSVGFCFDFFSDVSRKNCFGALDAFTASGCPGIFFLKTCNFCQQTLSCQENFYKRLQTYDSKKIVWVNDDWNRDVFVDWLRNLTVFLSLHRSEGFGFSLLESMALGIPCIATNYGGNTDFMTESNSFLVPFEKIATKISDSRYYSLIGDNAWWANPDVHAAATYLRRLYENDFLRTEMGLRGRLSVQTWYRSLCK